MPAIDIGPGTAVDRHIDGSTTAYSVADAMSPHQSDLILAQCGHSEGRYERAAVAHAPNARLEKERDRKGRSPPEGAHPWSRNKVQRRARRRTVAVRAATVLAAAVVAVVAIVAAAAAARRPRSVEVTNAATTGPSEPTTPAVELTGAAPTAADLDGIWTLDGGGHLLRFAAADKTFAIDDSGALIDGPEDAGTFSLSGNTLTLVAAGSAKCEDGQRAVWQVELLGDGRLHAIATLDECRLPAGRVDVDSGVAGQSVRVDAGVATVIGRGTFGSRADSRDLAARWRVDAAGCVVRRRPCVG